MACKDCNKQFDEEETIVSHGIPFCPDCASDNIVFFNPEDFQRC